MKKKKSLWCTAFFIIICFYGAVSCALQGPPCTEKPTFLKWFNENIKRMLHEMDVSLAFSEELYKETENVLREALKMELRELTNRSEKSPSERTTYYVSQIKVLQQKRALKREEQKKKDQDQRKLFEERQHKLKEQEDYYEKELVLKAIPDMVTDLCSQEGVSREDLAKAYMLTRFIEEQESSEGNESVISLYKDLQKKLQNKGRVYGSDRKMIPYQEVYSHALDEKIREFYADYFFKNIREAVNAFCSLKTFFYSKELHRNIKDLIDLMGKAIEHEESSKRVACYSLLQDGILKKYAEMQQKNDTEKAEKTKIDLSDKQPGVSKNKKRYRDKRKKNKVKK